MGEDSIAERLMGLVSLLRFCCPVRIHDSWELEVNSDDRLMLQVDYFFLTQTSL